MYTHTHTHTHTQRAANCYPLAYACSVWCYAYAKKATVTNKRKIYLNFLSWPETLSGPHLAAEVYCTKRCLTLIPQDGNEAATLQIFYVVAVSHSLSVAPRQPPCTGPRPLSLWTLAVYRPAALGKGGRGLVIDWSCGGRERGRSGCEDNWDRLALFFP